MESIRCAACGRLLARGRVEILEIKCPRCKTLNVLRPGARASPDCCPKAIERAGEAATRIRAGRP